MELKSYKASAPGSLMLLGEHAVLQRKHALVAAIDQRITVELIPHDERTIKINSHSLGTLELALDQFEIKEPFQFILQTIDKFREKIPSGFTLEINAEFSATCGLGSSAAVTVATLAVLILWLEQKTPDLMQLYLTGKEIINLVQGVGSGADVAASVFGGVVAYRTSPLLLERIAVDLPLITVYSGSKLATKNVVAQVERLRARHVNIFELLYETIDRCVMEASDAIKAADWERLGEIMDIHQGLQDALGVNNPTLAKIIFALRKHKKVLGAKISGSGLGDCVIALGSLPHDYFADETNSGIEVLDLKISERGVEF